MYARLTTFRVKPGQLETMRRWRDENEGRIYAQPGLREWIGMMDDSGEFFVLALFDDERAAKEALPQARALWADMAAMIESEPTARFLNVLAAENIAMRGVVAA